MALLYLGVCVVFGSDVCDYTFGYYFIVLFRFVVNYYFDLNWVWVWVGRLMVVFVVTCVVSGVEFEWDFGV